MQNSHKLKISHPQVAQPVSSDYKQHTAIQLNQTKPHKHTMNYLHCGLLRFCGQNCPDKLISLNKAPFT